MKPNHLLRMRRSGWFDVLVFFMAIGLILGAMGLAGLLQYNSIQTSMAGATAYEVNQAQTFLSGSHRSYLTLSVIFLSITAVSLLFMRFVSPAFSGSLQAQRFFRRRRVVLQHTAAIMITLVMLFPIYWMIITSLKLPREIYRVPALWPKTFTLDNFNKLLADGDFLLAIRNSAIVASTVTVISVIISSFAAYSMVRFRYRFRGVFGRLILFAYLTPGSLLFIPLSIVMAQLRLGNSLVGLILVYLTFSLPLSTWLLQGYFRGVPRELEEQGMIDGLTRFGALIRITLPLSAPGLAAVAIFTFTGAWNELLFALVLTTSESVRTAPLALNYLITSDVLPWGPLMAGAVISSVPLMILYFVAQRFMVAGMTEGSDKG